MPRNPSLQSVCERLAQLRGVPIYDIPLAAPSGELVGNNGDRLIRLGAQRLFDQHGLTFVADPASAELLLFGGNGGMLQKFQVIPNLFRDHWTRFPDKPLLMLPSTFYFPTVGVTAGLPQRSATVELYCRENVSYQHLTRDHQLPACCSVHLSHDTAFALADTPFVKQYQGRPGKHVLIVERDDTEHPSKFAVADKHRRTLKQMVPQFLKKPLYPLRARLASWRTTGFRKQCEALIQQHHGEQRHLPRIVRDVSRQDYSTFEEFCETIADAEIVLSTRLHVGIFAALLGKRTYIFDGPYHKIRAIYEHSMTGYANATLVSWTNH